MDAADRRLVDDLGPCEFILRFDRDPKNIKMKATISYTTFKKHLKIEKDAIVFYRRPGMIPKEVQFDDAACWGAELQMIR